MTWQYPFVTKSSIQVNLEYCPDLYTIVLIFNKQEKPITFLLQSEHDKDLVILRLHRLADTRYIHSYTAWHFRPMHILTFETPTWRWHNWSWADRSLAAKPIVPQQLKSIIPPSQSRHFQNWGRRICYFISIWRITEIWFFLAG